MPPLTLDLTTTLRELQMQHGLRAEDYNRYHKYLNNRLHSLRQQTKTTHGDRRRYVKRTFLKHNTNDNRVLLILALQSERAWATAQSLANTGDKNKLKHHRSRMRKASSWAQELLTLTQQVGDERAVAEAEAYAKEMDGRQKMSAAGYDAAKVSFTAARDVYAKLVKEVDPAARAAYVGKVTECDDRIVYCMQRLGEDITTYSPKDSLGDLDGTTKVSWLGRSVTVMSIKARDCLRQVAEISVEDLDTTAIATNQMAVSRMLDGYDRLIAALNEALQHIRDDLKEGAGDRTQLQMLQHYVLYSINKASIRRSMALVDVHAVRYSLTAEHVAKSKGSRPQQRGTFASPLELVRLYESAQQCAHDMQNLPGVEDDDVLSAEVSALEKRCRAGRFYYVAECWRIAGDATKATLAYDAVVDTVGRSSEPYAVKLIQSARAAKATMVADAMRATDALTNQLAQTSTGESSRNLMDCQNEFVSCTAFQKFPPDYQSVVGKPAFYDMAATFVEFPDVSAEAGKAAPPKPAAAAHHDPNTEVDEGPGEKKGGWLGGWFKKK